MRVGALERDHRIHFLDRVGTLLEKVDYRAVVADSERDQIFRMRYDAYRREGAIAPNFAGRLSDSYDDADNTWLFGVFIDGELASSIRLTVAAPSFPKLPAMQVFSDLLEPEIAAGKIIIDPTRFVTDAALSRRYPDLRYVTTRLAWIACEYFHADSLLATVRAEHQAFYRRVFGHRAFGEPRTYPSLTKPIVFMNLDYLQERSRVNGRFPFFRSTFFERRMLFEQLQRSATAALGERLAYPEGEREESLVGVAR